MKKENLEDWKAKTELEKSVKDIILNYVDYYEELEDFFQDLMEGGCNSGMITELIYYDDTVKFYEDHREDIQSLLIENIEMLGFNSPSEIFKNWDKKDIFAVETNNKNILAWFAFEETARKISDDLGINL